MNNEKRTLILKKLRWIAFTIAAIIAISAIPAATWFYYERRVGAIAEIDSPISLYINAGNQEDIVYLDLSDIDVDRAEDRAIGKYYKDFVFCVRGYKLENYILQLGYTTNNQFDYHIYMAEEVDDKINTVSYIDQNGNLHYYRKTRDAELEYDLLNDRTVGNEILGLIPNDDKTYYQKAYEEYSTAYVDKYAVPIYWKATEAEKADQSTPKVHFNGYNPEDNESEGFFCDYYILRVDWARAVTYLNKINDRETDILYIAAGK